MKPNFNDMLRHIAREEGISQEEVLAEMEKAIDAGYRNPDPEVRAYWAAMPFDRRPTAEEFVSYLAGLIEKNGMQ